ncbi:MAG: pseudaminic acid synthase [Leptospiraceae bacterium]|nr:pseudaminic acid synthase [Leptospiraceae bacterium]
MFQIADRIIGPDEPPFIIAEMSANHNGSLDRAIELVRAAAESGAEAIKLQTYTADTMTIDAPGDEFQITDPNSLWTGYSLYDLYKHAATPWEWHGPIMQECARLGLICFSSPFDLSAVRFLEELSVPAYKIASFELVDLRLIEEVARTGKPMIISTGMATVNEIADAVAAARDQGNEQIALLKCTSSYPSDPRDSNVATIPHLREMFGLEVGLSDHTLGIGAALASVALGGTIIEKHFTLDRSEGGVDSAFSLEPADLKLLIAESRSAWKSVGHVHYGPGELERPSLVFRRSLYFVEDVAAGERITPENVRSIRPGLGLAPKYLKTIIGREVETDVRRGTPVRWELLSHGPST